MYSAGIYKANLDRHDYSALQLFVRYKKRSKHFEYSSNTDRININSALYI